MRTSTGKESHHVQYSSPHSDHPSDQRATDMALPKPSRPILVFWPGASVGALFCCGQEFVTLTPDAYARPAKSFGLEQHSGKAVAVRRAALLAAFGLAGKLCTEIDSHRFSGGSFGANVTSAVTWEGAMRDILKDLQERASLIEDEIFRTESHFEELKRERDIRVGELKAELAVLGVLMDSERQRLPNVPRQMEPEEQRALHNLAPAQSDLRHIGERIRQLQDGSLAPLQFAERR
jgi:hypothetical protein